jgi:L-aspartate oxidase
MKKFLKTDYLVIGSGIAGLYTSFKLSSLGEVTLITKEGLSNSNTQIAQGGIAAVLNEGDSWESHLKDTLEAGDGACNCQAVKILVTEGPKRVLELMNLGVKFDSVDGKLDFTQEGAHSKRRILHARGDATGAEIEETLSEVVEDQKNIKILENTFLLDLLIDEKKAVGAIAFNENEFIIFLTRAVIIATGGCAYIYENTSNPPVTTGDGIAAAYRGGANIIDMEFVQFHPTTFCGSGEFSFLISESLRGEGAVLVNSKGERFMHRYHSMADLAPRDIVSRSMIEEAKREGMPHVWLKMNHLDPNFIIKRFPTIFSNLKKYGYDIRKDLIPVTPAAHYLMGGIQTDMMGRTAVKGLFACGEAACTGVHGANRLASNSLLEGLVFGHRIYRAIKEGVDDNQIESTMKFKNSYKDLTKKFLATENIGNDKKLSKLIREFRKNMTEKAGIIRNKEGLEYLVKWLKTIQKDINEEKVPTISKFSQMRKGDYKKLKAHFEFRNMLTVGELIARSALKREESRGSHYRLDFPHRKKELMQTHFIFNKKNPEGKECVLREGINSRNSV